jgi:glucose-6-phosphate 1-dehydrogenase
VSELAVSPFREGLAREVAPPPCTIVIFGATGDLAHRKLAPALYTLRHEGLLPSRFAIVGYARSAFTNVKFAEDLKASVAEHTRVAFEPMAWDEFAKACRT